MPMNDGVLSKLILKTIRLNMKSLSPAAAPQEFQEELANAVAKGTISVLKQAKTVGGGVEVLKSGIGLIVSGTLMATTATKAMQGFSGGGGIALEKIMQSLMLPISAHLATNVEIESTSGFGGQGGPPIGAVASKFEKAIFKELKSDTQKNMKKSKQGMFFIKSISLGLGAGMAVAIPGIVPAAGATTGALVGIFK